MQGPSGASRISGPGGGPLCLAAASCTDITPPDGYVRPGVDSMGDGLVRHGILL